MGIRGDNGIYGRPAVLATASVNTATKGRAQQRRKLPAQSRHFSPHPPPWLPSVLQRPMSEGGGTCSGTFDRWGEGGRRVRRREGAGGDPAMPEGGKEGSRGSRAHGGLHPRPGLDKTPLRADPWQDSPVGQTYGRSRIGAKREGGKTHQCFMRRWCHWWWHFLFIRG